MHRNHIGKLTFAHRLVHADHSALRGLRADPVRSTFAHNGGNARLGGKLFSYVALRLPGRGAAQADEVPTEGFGRD